MSRRHQRLPSSYIIMTNILQSIELCRKVLIKEYGSEEDKNHCQVRRMLKRIDKTLKIVYRTVGNLLMLAKTFF